MIIGETDGHGEDHRREARRRKRRHASSACTWSARGSPSSSAQGYLAVNWEATVDEVAHFIQPHPSLSELFGESVLAHDGKEPARLMADVTMPQLGETVTEGTITKWFKKVGDPVAEDEALFEVSTDKVDTEVPSPTAGFIAEIRVPEGDTVDVGALLAVISSDAGAQPATRRAARRRACTGPGRRSGAHRCRSAARRRQPRHLCPKLRPTGARQLPLPHKRPLLQPQLRPRRVRPATSCSRRWCAGSSPSTVSIPPRSRARAPVVASPATTCSITSTSTSATAAWLRQLPRLPHAAAPAVAAPAPAAPRPAAVAPTAAPGQREEVVTLPKIRKLTGEHMVMSLATSPHAFSVVEVDYENVDRVRRAHMRRLARAGGLHASRTCRSSRGRSSTRSPSSRA